MTCVPATVEVYNDTAAINRIQLRTNGASTNFATRSRVQIFGYKTVGILT